MQPKSKPRSATEEYASTAVLDAPPPTPPANAPAPPAATPASADVQPLVAPMPPPLGHAPTSINQMIPKTGTAPKGTHFTGPVVSGPPPGSPLGVQGAAMLVLGLQLDYSMGNFNLPIQFPAGAILMSTGLYQYQAFTTPPTVSLGRTSGAADILALVTLPAAIDAALWQTPAGTLPFVNETNSGQAFLNVAANAANTAGGAMLLFAYVIVPRPWN